MLALLEKLRRSKHRDTTYAQALQVRDERFRVIWELAADAMALSDEAGIVLDANPAYYRLYGYAPHEVIGKNFAIIFPEDQRASAIEAYNTIFNSRTEISNQESTIRRADGSLRTVEARNTYVPVNDTQIAMLSIIRDVTERKLLLEREHEARAKAEQALKIRDLFLSVASHELKTPITTIMGYAQAMLRRARREHTLSERDLRTVTTIEQQARRIQKLIDSLLDISRIEAGKFVVQREPVNVCILVQHLVENIQDSLEKKNVLQLDCVEEPLVVAGDALRLEQVLYNLIGNALKYSPEAGTISVRVERAYQQARISITDQGIGIPQAAQVHLFEQFYRAENTEAMSGMGIGLYVAKEIVALHNGTIEVVSQEGTGSTFTVCLPLMRDTGLMQSGSPN